MVGTSAALFGCGAGGDGGAPEGSGGSGAEAGSDPGTGGSTTPGLGGSDPGDGGSGGGEPTSGDFTLNGSGILCYGPEGETTNVRVGGDCQGNLFAEYADEFADPIVLTAEDLPLGVTVELGTEELVPDARYSLTTIRVRGAAAEGPLDVTIRGTTRSHGSATLQIPLTVTSRPGFALARVAVGHETACGVDEVGAAYCWGNNTYGELGLGTSGVNDDDYDRLKPTPVTGDVVFAQVVPGADGRMTCGLDTEGAAYCWGQAYLGDGGYHEPGSGPVAVAGGLTFTDLVVGMASCGLTDEGAVYCWAGGNGFLGNGTYDQGMVPMEISGGRTYKAIAAGAETTCALTVDGALYCWGNNTYGEVGDGTRNAALEPTEASFDVSFESIALGHGFGCGLIADGSAYCWGTNGAGTLGTGSYDSEYHFEPEPVAGGLTFSALSASGATACGLDEEGSAYCWGNAAESNTAALMPRPLLGGLTFSQISVGDKNSCGVATNGLEATYCWVNGAGSNTDGYLGTGDTDTYRGPVPIAAP